MGEPIERGTGEEFNTEYFGLVLEWQICSYEQALTFIGHADDVKEKLGNSLAVTPVAASRAAKSRTVPR